MKSPYKVAPISECSSHASSSHTSSSHTDSSHKIGGSTGRSSRRRWLASLLAIPVLAGPGLLMACSGSDSAVGQPAVAETVDASGSAILARVNPTEGEALLENGAILIDVRTPEEYQQVRIDGAELIDVSAPDFDARVSELDPNAAYVIYCRTGNRSAVAVDRMAKLGFTEVYDMGGIDVWLNEGRPVISG